MCVLRQVPDTVCLCSSSDELLDEFFQLLADACSEVSNSSSTIPMITCFHCYTILPGFFQDTELEQDSNETLTLVAAPVADYLSEDFTMGCTAGEENDLDKW